MTGARLISYAKRSWRGGRRERHELRTYREACTERSWRGFTACVAGGRPYLLRGRFRVRFAAVYGVVDTFESARGAKEWKTKHGRAHTKTQHAGKLRLAGHRSSHRLNAHRKIFTSSYSLGSGSRVVGVSMARGISGTYFFSCSHATCVEKSEKCRSVIRHAHWPRATPTRGGVPLSLAMRTCAIIVSLDLTSLSSSASAPNGTRSPRTASSVLTVR